MTILREHPLVAERGHPQSHGHNGHFKCEHCGCLHSVESILSIQEVAQIYWFYLFPFVSIFLDLFTLSSFTAQELTQFTLCYRMLCSSCYSLKYRADISFYRNTRQPQASFTNTFVVFVACSILVFINTNLFVFNFVISFLLF